MKATELVTIRESGILTSDDLETVSALMPELEANFKKSQVFRTRTEIEVSVLNSLKHPTAQSKYWQSVREQAVMFNELVMTSFEYRKNVVKIKILQRKYNIESDDLKRELLQIDIDKRLYMSKNYEKAAKDRIRELSIWSEIKERESSGMTTDELADVDNHQLISYTIRWIKQSIEMGDNGSPSERQNLIGQLHSGIVECINRGVIDAVLKNFPQVVRKQIAKEYRMV